MLHVSHPPAEVDASAILRTAVRALSRGVIPSVLVVAVAGAAMIGVNRALDALMSSYPAAPPLVQAAVAQPFRLFIATWVFLTSIAIALDVHGRRPQGPLATLARARRALVTGLGYQFALLVGFGCFVVPGCFVMARRSLATPAAMEESLDSSTAWQRSAALTESSRGLVLRMSLCALTLRFAVNVFWPDTGALSEQLGGGDAVWYALAFFHQCLALAPFVVDGSIAAALYVHLRDARLTLDASAIAEAFD
jgi:hypothetical protein